MQAAANTVAVNQLDEDGWRAVIADLTRDHGLDEDGWRAVIADLTLDLGAARAAALVGKECAAALVGAASATAASAVTAAAPGPTPSPGTHKRRAACDLPDKPSKYGEGYFRANPDGTRDLVFCVCALGMILSSVYDTDIDVGKSGIVF